MKNKAEDFTKVALRVSNVSITGNIVLALAKFFAGIVAHSQAMVSDAIHSGSDVISSIIVIIGVKLASKEADKEHPYGHERLEAVASIILAGILAFTGLFLGHTAIEKLISNSFLNSKMPGILALIAAIVSIACKEAMYWYTRHYAKEIDSGALMADAWHHRSDALSSVGSLIGIVGTRMGYLWFDLAASLIICVFILKASFDIFKDAIQKMIDHSCSDKTENDIAECAMENAGICGIKEIRTREFGNKIYVDLALFADPDMTLRDSSSLAKDVHDAIEIRFPKIKHITVVMYPKESE